MYIHREIEQTLSEAIKRFRVITITGPRQSGKTTLIKKQFGQLPYYSLEDPGTQMAAKQDPNSFLARHTQGMILDEVQRTPELLSCVQSLVDSNPDMRFVLSGSSNFRLMSSVTQTLAGRAAVLELMPLTIAEAKGHTENIPVDQLLFNGLYPDAVTNPSQLNLLYNSYINTYIERDVRALLNIRDLPQFQVFLKLCAARAGSVFNANELTREVGISQKTITNWLNVLQTSYIVFMLQPYHANIRKRLTKSPKIYFCDTGLLCAILGIESVEALERDRMRGFIFENLIVSEFIKRRLNAGLRPNIAFYRDSNGNEVDVVEETRDGLNLIEIKSAATFNEGFGKVLRGFSQNTGLPVSSRTVIYTGDIEGCYNGVDVVNYKTAFYRHSVVSQTAT